MVWKPGGLEAWRSGGLGAIFRPKFGQNIVFFNVFEQNVLKTIGFLKDSGKYVLKTIGFSMILRVPRGRGPRSLRTWVKGS